MTDAPAFYPEECLETHGIAPDDFHCAGVYCLELDTPDDPREFAHRWAAVYEVDPDPDLMGAVIDGVGLYYVGSADSLLDRLHDHVTGDVRQVGLLGVCPPVGLAAVWPEADAEAARDHERQRAYAWREETGGAVYVDGDVV